MFGKVCAGTPQRKAGATGSTDRATRPPDILRNLHKIWILASAQGGCEFIAGGIHRYFEDDERAPNADMEPKDFFKEERRSISKSGFWFEIKAGPRIKPQAYSCMSRIGAEGPTPISGEKTFLRCF